MLVLNDSVSGLVEGAAYCAPGDEKRPSLVGLPDFTTSQVCPEDVSQPAPPLTNAAPDTFYVRIMFDELLDPNIEDLVPILDEEDQETGSFTGTLINTQPVTFKCTGVDGAMHDVPYDGYYSPSGNAVTWPLGPSLVIKPLGEFIIPTNSQCEITLKDNITDKDGNPVPDMQRGPFPFSVAPLTPIFIDPEDGTEDVDAALLQAANFVFIQFNGNVDPTSWCDEGAAMDECEFKITPDIGPVFPDGAGPEWAFLFGPLVGGDAMMTETEYTFEITGGTIRDECGAETTLAPGTVDGLSKTSFTTAAFEQTTASPGNGDVVPSNRKPTIFFSNFIDPASIAADEITITPAPTSGGLASVAGIGLRFVGHYQPDTEYTYTIKGGAMFSDVHGAMYTNETEKVIKYKTQPIAITASSPANGATVTKATPTSQTAIAFSFNQSMDPTTWTAEDVELTGAATPLSFAASGCTATSTSCALVAVGTFAPGTYTLTLKAGATINDALGNTYTQANARSITFSVQEAPPPDPVIPCLGE